jgi:hypothetical protein
MRRARKLTLFILHSLVLCLGVGVLVGCDQTGILLHLEPLASATPPRVDVRVCRPDGSDPCTRALTAFDGMTTHPRDVLTYVTDDTPQVSLRFEVGPGAYCQLIPVGLSHGHTVELTVSPDQCTLRETGKCASCGDPATCPGSVGTCP